MRRIARALNCLHHLKVGLEQGRITVSEEILADAFEQLKGNHEESNIQEQRCILKALVQKFEVGNKQGRFALSCACARLCVSTPGGVLPIYTLHLDFA